MSSSVSVILQQQNPLLTDVSASSIIPFPGSDGPFSIWSAVEIADAATAPLDSVLRNWPLVYAALRDNAIDDIPVQMAAIGTIAVETAHTFEPVREAFWLSEAWRAANLRYYPYYGRGFIQLTWGFNYAKYGNLIDKDLLNDPELAMEPFTAAQVLAEYFIQADVVSAARAYNWAEVRRRVQGAYAGLDTLTAVVWNLEHDAALPDHAIVA